MAETVESEQDVLIYSLTWIDLACTDGGDILIFMLAWQKKTSVLKQPKQVNHVIKKKKLSLAVFPWS